MINVISSKKINENLQVKKNIKVLLKTTSTNDVLKNNLNKGVQVVISEKQSKGRGRFNRKFHSPYFNGIYMSLLLNGNYEYEKIGRITTFIALAVSKSIEELYGVKAGIKWINDIIINGKKVCGILTESVIKNGKISSIIAGIGINVYNKKFHKDIEKIASSLYIESGKKIDRNLLISHVINKLEDIENDIKNDNFIEEYQKKLVILNKQIMVSSVEENYLAYCLGVDNLGRLIVERNGKKEYLINSDVSVKSI